MSEKLLYTAESSLAHTLVPVLTVFGIIFVEYWILKKLWQKIWEQPKTEN